MSDRAMRRFVNRAFNVLLRGLSLVAKFALVFSLARFLEPADVGLYGLVLATVTYVQFALGFDFYYYANRELVGAQGPLRARILRDQGVFLAVCYAVVLPMSLLLFMLEVLPWKAAIAFYVLLVLEQVAHEISRVLIAISRPVLATTLFFLRAGAWVVVLLPVMWQVPAARTLDAVWIAWISGALLACVIGLVRMIPLFTWDSLASVDWSWIGRGIRVSLPLLIATLALKGLNTFDRYSIEAIGGLEVVGAYVLFVGIAAAVKASLDAGVFVFGYPGLIRSANEGNVTIFHARIRRMAWHAAAVTIGLCATALAVIGPVLEWIGRGVYDDNLALLYWSLLSVVLYAASMVFHYALYARHRDSVIVKSQLAGLAVFAAATLLLQRWFGYVAVPIAVCLGHLAILIWKAIEFRRTEAQMHVAAPERA